MDHVAALLLGLGNGGVFAALALAIVLTYRSSGVLNFSTGVMALYSAYTYAGLRRGQLVVIIPGLPAHVDVGGELGFVPAALIALALTSLLGAVLYLLVFRPLRNAPPLARAVASLGVLVVIQSTFAIRLGTDAVSVSPIFPFARWTFGSLVILSDRFYLALSVVGLSVLLAALYRFTRFGLLTRATSESETGAHVSGIRPDRIALANWMISAAVAGAAGILIAPLSPLTPVTYTLFVVPALAAAVVGGFQYLLPTVVAGIAIGMLQSEGLSLAAKYSWMPRSGSAELVPLIVILVALLARRRPMPSRGGLIRLPLGRAPRPRSFTVPIVAGALVGFVGLALTHGTWRAAVIWSFIAGIIGLSLVVVTGFAGQVSAAQLTLAGCAAFTLSGLTSWHVPFPIAPILAALAATVVGLLVALPALRLRGLTLGVVTLAFALAVEAAWFRNSQLVPPQGKTVVQPHLFGIDLGIGAGAAFPRIGFGVVCLVALVIVAAGVAWLRRSALGSAMLAVRADERSAAGLGVNVVLVKIAAFAIAGFIAGLGGALLAYRQGTVTYDSYTALGNLNVLSTGYLAGVTSVFGGVLAGLMSSSGVVFTALEHWVNLGEWFDVITGIGLILVLITHPEGLASIGHAIAQRLPLPHRRTREGSREPAADTEASAASEPEARRPEPERLLEVTDLSVRYGGVMAVDQVSLRVDAGAIVGLIGPNGAGKTSVVDAISGFTPARGQVRLRDERIGEMASHRRVRRGLVRTFQSLDLYDDLSVEENLNVAAVMSSPEQRAQSITAALDLVGIGDLRDRAAGDLSQGERQLVSMARACAGNPLVLLLDEPAAGLDTNESVWLGERIRAVASRGTGVLLIDHDVALVLSVCDYVYVLDYGQVIAEGPPDTIRGDRAVTEAYLGSITEKPEITETPEPVS